MCIRSKTFLKIELVKKVLLQKTNKIIPNILCREYTELGKAIKKTIVETVHKRI